MKTTISFLIVIAVLLIGCDKNEIDCNEKLTDGLCIEHIDKLTDGFCIVTNDKVVLNHYDLEYYDYSTHLIYMKDHMSFEEDIKGIGGFKIYANENEIYSGQTLSGFSSSLPSGPVILTHPSHYGDNIISIGIIQITDTLGNLTPDPREDERIVNALKKYNQFHAGLSCEINSVQYLSSNNVKVELLLKNNDSFNYYYLDPEKTGIGLFHYFTNGLFIKDFNNLNSYTHKIEVISVDPWNSWNKDWLSIIYGNESKIITIIYDNFENVPTGQYNATFEFPGLSYQVEKKDIDQNDGQIWLGKLNMKKEITIE